MKHFPKPLISFRRLQGGQFGTLDVQATGPNSVQLALGSDFVRLTRSQWIAMRSNVDRFFGCETEAVVVTVDERDGGSVVFEETEDDDVEPAPPPPPQARNRPPRGRSATR